MSKSTKAREKFEKISQRKSNAYLNTSNVIAKEKPLIVQKKKKSKPINSSTTLKNISDKFRDELIQKATVSELKFKTFLDKNMINYQFQKIIYVSVDGKQKFYIADFFFKQYNIIVELDGGYHYTPEQKIKDDTRSIDLRHSGYFIIRFDNSRVSDCRLMYDEIIKFIEEKFGNL